MELKNQVAVLTGAARGIGKGFSVALLRTGAKVCLLDIQKDQLQETHKELVAEFGDDYVTSHVCDVRSETDIRDGFQHAVDKFGHVDVMVNNAGVGGDVNYERTVDVNVTGVIRGTIVALEHMNKEQGGKGGTIVSISSIVGLVPASFNPVYSATKHAVVALTRSYGMPHVFERKGVRVMCICPWAVETPLLYLSSENYRDPSELEETADFLQKFRVLSTDEMGAALVKLLKTGTTGDCVCVLPDKPLVKVETPQIPQELAFLTNISKPQHKD